MNDDVKIKWPIQVSQTDFKSRTCLRDSDDTFMNAEKLEQVCLLANTAHDLQERLEALRKSMVDYVSSDAPELQGSTAQNELKLSRALLERLKGGV